MRRRTAIRCRGQNGRAAHCGLYKREESVRPYCDPQRRGYAKACVCGGVMRVCPVLILIGGALGMSACAQNPMNSNTTFLDRYAEQNPTTTSILECHGFSCSETSRASLSRDSWRRIAATFVPRAKDAQSERRQIAHAVALMQLLVGQQTGTAVHQWTHRDKDILPNLSDPTQLDCIDEAANPDLSDADGAWRTVSFPRGREAFRCWLSYRSPKHGRNTGNRGRIFRHRSSLGRRRRAAANHPTRQLDRTLAA